MMREIGSEFWDIPLGQEDNGLFPGDTRWYISGRSALKAVISDLRGCRSVAVPSWCCGSMVKPFTDAGMRVAFYPVRRDGGLVQEPALDCDALFLMDYFGYESDVSDYSSFRGVRIRDVSHAVFSSFRQDADYYFGSLRKWCGIRTGGYAWTRDGHLLTAGGAPDEAYCRLREEAMARKARYIAGETDDKGFLEVYGEAEEMLDGFGILAADPEDAARAFKLDVGFIQRRRRENAEILYEAVGEWAVFPREKMSACPMFVPILVPEGKRDTLRSELTQRGIYCPVHWPDGGAFPLDEEEKFLYDNGLSLVCDQRYGPEDMERIADTVREFREKVWRC